MTINIEGIKLRAQPELKIEASAHRREANGNCTKTAKTTHLCPYR